MEKLVWKMRNLKAIEKMVLDYLLTNHHANCLGYYYIPIEYIVVDLSLERGDVEEAIDGLVEKNFVAYDKKASVVAIADFDRYEKFEDRINPVAYLVEEPASGVFVTCLKWLSEYTGVSVAREMATSRWIKDAIAMAVNTAGTNELTKASFYLFWSVFPKKADKELASKKYVDIIESGDYDSEQLLEAALNYAEECRRRRLDRKNTECASTFLDPQKQPFKEYIGKILRTSEISELRRKTIAELAPIRADLDEDCPF